MSDNETGELNSTLVRRLLEISDVNQRLLELMHKEIQEGKLLQIELGHNIKTIAHTVDELKNIIFGHGDRESLPMLVQRLNLELEHLSGRVAILEQAQKVAHDRDSKKLSIWSDRGWSLFLSLAPATLFALLVVAFMVMSLINPNMTTRIRNIGEPQSPPVAIPQPQTKPNP